MLTKSKIALSFALMLGTGSAALAATKHPIRHQRMSIERQMRDPAYQSFGSARGPAQIQEPLYMYIQDLGWRNSI
jgi:hypothetical protein